MNMMTTIPAGAERTMSSLEIGELTGKRHDNVMRDTREMLDGLGITHLSFEGSYKDSTSRTLRCFHLPKRETLILVSGYSVAMRAAIIDRWQQLEFRIGQVHMQACIIARSANSSDHSHQG